jgi:hypothetical protein
MTGKKNAGNGMSNEVGICAISSGISLLKIAHLSFPQGEYHSAIKSVAPCWPRSCIVS